MRPHDPAGGARDVRPVTGGAVGPGRAGLSIALGYLVVAVLWILLSDRALELLVKEPGQLERFQTFKGIFFVVVTSLLLWLTVRAYLQQMARDAETRLAAERARTKAEEALRHSQEKFTQAFEHNPAAIALHRVSDGVVLEMNTTWEKLFGYPRTEMIGRSVRSLWKDQGSRERVMAELHVHGQVAETEQEAVKRNGETVIVDLNSRLLTLHGEQVVLTTLLDVSARRREQLTRERQQRRIKLLADISHRLVVADDPRTSLGEIFRDLVQELDVDIFAHYAIAPEGDRLLLENSAGLDDAQRRDFAVLQFGQSLCGLVAERRTALLFADLPTVAVPQAAGIISLGVKAYSGHPLTQGGRLIGTISFGSRRREHYDEEDVRLMQAVANQVSAAVDRVRLLEALQTNEERFRQMAENIADVFWMVEVETDAVLYVSPAYERIWGRPCAELAERSEAWIEAVVPEDRAKVERGVSSQAAGFREEYRIMRPDGTIRWITDQGFPVRDAHGRVYRVAGVARDITEKKQLEEQFLRAQRVEAVGTLASGVAHDLNNILAPIMMVSGLLRRKYPDEDHRLLDLVEQSARRGAGIVAQLLTFSRGLGGEKVEHQVDHLVKEIAHLLEETFPRNIAISHSCARDLPAVLANPTQIHQVLMNLSVNARDAMPDGGTLVLRVRAVEVPAAQAATHEGAKPGNYVVLSVEDTGKGIPPEVRTRIFDPFFTTKEIGKGTGLGLATVIGIVRGHGGFLEFESECGRGTRFDVYLPAAGSGAMAVAAPSESDLPRSRGECVLIVDDEKSIRTAMRELLQSRGFRVLDAADGPAAEQLLRAHAADVKLVITDFMMPGIDGLVLAPRLRAIAPVPVILCSGAGHEFEAARLAAAGVQRALAKPLTARTLLEAVTQTLL